MEETLGRRGEAVKEVVDVAFKELQLSLALWQAMHSLQTGSATRWILLLRQSPHFASWVGHSCRDLSLINKNWFMYMSLGDQWHKLNMPNLVCERLRLLYCCEMTKNMRNRRAMKQRYDEAERWGEICSLFNYFQELWDGMAGHWSITDYHLKMSADNSTC